MDLWATVTSSDDPARSILGAILAHHKSHDDMAVLVLERANLCCQSDDVRIVCSFDSADRQSARTVRKELADFMRRFTRDDEQHVFSAEVVLGEILANVVEHAPEPVEIEVDWQAEKPRVCARDSGPGLQRKVPHLPSDTLAESGSGLFLIHTLADRFS